MLVINRKSLFLQIPFHFFHQLTFIYISKNSFLYFPIRIDDQHQWMSNNFILSWSFYTFPFFSINRNIDKIIVECISDLIRFERCFFKAFAWSTPCRVNIHKDECFSFFAIAWLNVISWNLIPLSLELGIHKNELKRRMENDKINDFFISVFLDL